MERVASPIGTIQLVCDEAGRLRALDFDDHEARLARLLRLHYGDRYTATAARVPAAVREALDAFFAGAVGAIDAITVETAGTEFQRRVWAALRRHRPATVASAPRTARAPSSAGG